MMPQQRICFLRMLLVLPLISACAGFLASPIRSTGIIGIENGDFNARLTVFARGDGQACCCSRCCRRRRRSLVDVRRLESSFDDDIEFFGGGSNQDDSKNDDAILFQSLRERANQISQKTQTLINKWKKGDCKSTLPLMLPDWVRRLDVDYPLVACGSSEETVYLGHLKSGEIIAKSETGSSYSGSIENDEDEDDNDANKFDVSDDALKQTLRYMFGNYDGGGTLSIAFHGSLICEGTRKGGVRIWRIDPSTKNLVSQGSIPAMKGLLATCLHLDEDHGRLWVGTHTGEVHNYLLDDPLKPLALQTHPYQIWSFGGASRSCILSLHFCFEFNCGVAALGDGSVQLFSTVSNEPIASAIATLYPPFDSTGRRSAYVFPTHACLVQTKTDLSDDESTDNKEISGLSIVCGGSDGSMDCQKIAILEDGEIDTDRPFQEPIRSMGHGHLIGKGLVKAMVSPAANMVVSLGQDGCMRVWDVPKRKPFYIFQGYKVWAGSLWTDGRRLISDGVDNSILMHDFGESENDEAA